MHPFIESAVLSVSLFAVDAAVTTNPSELGAFLEKYGIAVLLLFYFIGRDHLSSKHARQREVDAQDERKADKEAREKLEKYIRDELTKALRHSTDSIQATRRMTEECYKAVQNCQHKENNKES